MDYKNFILKYISIDKERIVFELSYRTSKTLIIYNKPDESFSYKKEPVLSELLNNKEKQLKKIVKSALKGNSTVGQQISGVFIENFPFLNADDFQYYIRVDRRYKNLNIHISHEETATIHKIIADGSYAQDLKQSGYAGIVEDEINNRIIYQASFKEGSSNLMELMAVIEGLQLLVKAKKIQINTDSRFVIRGLAQWIHFWKLNNWQTAQGQKVKYAGQWQQLDKITEGKLLELKWIKGHSGHVDHCFCHDLAKQIATQKL